MKKRIKCLWNRKGHTRKGLIGVALLILLSLSVYAVLSSGAPSESSIENYKVDTSKFGIDLSKYGDVSSVKRINPSTELIGATFVDHLSNEFPCYNGEDYLKWDECYTTTKTDTGFRLEFATGEACTFDYPLDIAQKEIEVGKHSTDLGAEANLSNMKCNVPVEFVGGDDGTLHKVGNYFVKLDPSWWQDSDDWDNGAYSNTYNDGENVTSNPNHGHWYIEQDQVGHWQFENSGNLTLDSSGMGHDGHVTGAVQVSDGYVRNGYNFSSAGDWIDLTDDLGLTTDFTLMGWFKIREQRSDSGYIMMNDAGTVFVRVDYLENIEVGRKVGAVWYQMPNAKTLSKGKWYHFAYIHNSTNETLYVNGEFVKMIPGVSTAIPNWGATLGAAPSHTGVFNGTIDELVFYNRSFTGEEIKTVYDYMKANYSSLGNYTSQTFDASSATNPEWSMTWDDELLSGTNISMQFRTSNDASAWTGWSNNITKGQASLNESGKYFQYRATFIISNANNTAFLKTVNVSYEEAPIDSYIRNDESTNTSVCLLMLVQFDNAGSWEDDAIIVNDTTCSRRIEPGLANQLDIGTLWNSNPWNTSTNSHGSGTYRAYVAVTDENDVVLTNKDGSLMEKSYNFTLTV